MEVSLSEEIEALKKERNHAIEMCDFARSRELDVHIKVLIAQNNENNEETDRIKRRLEFSILREKLLSEKANLNTNLEEKIAEIKLKYQNRMLAIGEEEAEEKRVQNEKQARELELETNRRIPEAEDKRNAAKIQARKGNYDEADKLMEEFNELTKLTIEKRIREINLKYALFEENLNEKYQNKKILCQKRLSRDIRFIQDQHDAAITRIEKELHAAEIRSTKPSFKTTHVGSVHKESNRGLKGSSIMTTPTKTTSRTSSRSSKTPNKFSRSIIRA